MGMAYLDPQSMYNNGLLEVLGHHFPYFTGFKVRRVLEFTVSGLGFRI